MSRKKDAPRRTPAPAPEAASFWRRNRRELAFPAYWKSRLAGLALGIFAIQIVNVVRVAALFLTGVYFPKIFDASHTVIWQTIVILFGVLLWVFWANRFAVPPAPAEPAT